MIISSRFISAPHGHVYCPLYPEGYQNEADKEYFQDGAVVGDIKRCEATLATERVMRFCHGQKFCNLTGDPGLLGVDMCSDLYVVLKIV